MAATLQTGSSSRIRVGIVFDRINPSCIDQAGYYKCKRHGHFVEIMLLAMQIMRRDYQFVPVRDQRWGGMYNGTVWNGAVGDIQQGFIDVTLPCMTVTDHRKKVVDFVPSVAYYREYAAVLYRHTAESVQVFQWWKTLDVKWWTWLIAVILGKFLLQDSLRARAARHFLQVAYASTIPVLFLFETWTMRQLMLKVNFPSTMDEIYQFAVSDQNRTLLVEKDSALHNFIEMESEFAKLRKLMDIGKLSFFSDRESLESRQLHDENTFSIRAVQDASKFEWRKDELIFQKMETQKPSPVTSLLPYGSPLRQPLTWAFHSLKELGFFDWAFYKQKRVSKLSMLKDVVSQHPIGIKGFDKALIYFAIALHWSCVIITLEVIDGLAAEYGALLD